MSNYLIITLAISILLNVALWFLVYSALPKLSDLAPLHYSVYFGVDLIDSKTKLYILPIISVLIAIINFLIIFLISPRQKLATYFLGAGAIVAPLFLLIAFLNIAKNF